MTNFKESLSHIPSMLRKKINMIENENILVLIVSFPLESPTPGTQRHP